MPYYGALQKPIFQPAVADISSISQASLAVVTTTFATQYLTGLIVRLYIPQYFGMEQLNGFQGTITVLSPTTFTIPIDSTFFDPFVTPIQPVGQPLINPAQVVPIGEDAAILTQSFVNILTPQF